MKRIIASTGLSLKPTYDELLDYIQEDPDKVKYPNRTATILRRSFELSQLDGIGNLELEKMQVRKLVAEDKEVLLKQFANDWGLSIPEIKAWIGTRRLHPVRPDPDGGDERREEIIDDEAMPGHTGVPVGEETSIAIPIAPGEEEAAGMPVSLGASSSSGVKVKAREASTGPRGRGRPRNDEYVRPRVPPAGSSNSGGAPELPVMPPYRRGEGIREGIRIAGEVTSDTIGALGSVGGSGLSASAAVIEGGVNLAGAVAPPLFHATVGTVKLASRAVQAGANVASGIRSLMRRGGRDESPIERGSGSTRVAFVSEDEVNEAIHTHVGSRARTLSPLPDISAEEKRQASLLEQVASEAASSSSKSASASKVASEARSSLTSLEGSGQSSLSATTSRETPSAQEHFDISSPKEQKKGKKKKSEASSVSTERAEVSPLMPMNLQYALT